MRIAPSNAASMASDCMTAFLGIVYLDIDVYAGRVAGQVNAFGCLAVSVCFARFPALVMVVDVAHVHDYWPIPVPDPAYPLIMFIGALHECRHVFRCNPGVEAGFRVSVVFA